MRDFQDLGKWFEGVQECRISDGPADRIGCQRTIVPLGAPEGFSVVETLTALSDTEYSLSYQCHSPKSTGKIQLRPVTEQNLTFIEITVIPSGTAAEVEEAVREMPVSYRTAIANLKRLFTVG